MILKISLQKQTIYESKYYVSIFICYVHSRVYIFITEYKIKLLNNNVGNMWKHSNFQIILHSCYTYPHIFEIWNIFVIVICEFIFYIRLLLINKNITIPYHKNNHDNKTNSNNYGKGNKKMSFNIEWRLSSDNEKIVWVSVVLFQINTCETKIID